MSYEPATNWCETCGSWRYTATDCGQAACPFKCEPAMDIHPVPIGGTSCFCGQRKVAPLADDAQREAFMAGRTGQFFFVDRMWKPGKPGRTDELAYAAWLASRASAQKEPTP